MSSDLIGAWVARTLSRSGTNGPGRFGERPAGWWVLGVTGAASRMYGATGEIFGVYGQARIEGDPTDGLV
jgi:hypothetical protein